MPSLEIHPLSGLRDEAATLLAERYARQRAAEPFLPEIGDLEAELPDCDGLVATRGGKAVAYLAGEVREGIATVGFAGSAATEPEALRDLFGAQAPRWGTSRFAIAVPVSEPDLVDAWFRLAFGLQFVWSVRPAEPTEPVDCGRRHPAECPRRPRPLGALRRAPVADPGGDAELLREDNSVARGVPPGVERSLGRPGGLPPIRRRA